MYLKLFEPAKAINWFFLYIKCRLKVLWHRAYIITISQFWSFYLLIRYGFLQTLSKKMAKKPYKNWEVPWHLRISLKKSNEFSSVSTSGVEPAIVSIFLSAHFYEGSAQLSGSITLCVRKKESYFTCTTFLLDYIQRVNDNSLWVFVFESIILNMYCIFFFGLSQLYIL